MGPTIRLIRTTRLRLRFYGLLKFRLWDTICTMLLKMRRGRVFRYLSITIQPLRSYWLRMLITLILGGAILRSVHSIRIILSWPMDLLERSEEVQLSLAEIQIFILDFNLAKLGTRFRSIFSRRMLVRRLPEKNLDLVGVVGLVSIIILLRMECRQCSL